MRSCMEENGAVKAMKKVVILQSIGNLLGGVWFVNHSLAVALIEQGYAVTILNIRTQKDTKPLMYDSRITQITINTQDAWEIPPYCVAVEKFKSFHFLAGLRLAMDTYRKRKCLSNDFKASQAYIKKNKYDIIISSQYQTLDAIPQEYWNRTIHVQHTSFQQSFAHKGTRSVLKKYNGRIQFVWLTKASQKDAEAHGFQNCHTIYNPLRFPCIDEVAGIKNKTLITVTRFSEEKRIDRMIHIVKEVFQNREFDDWKLLIYGEGELKKTLKDLASECKQIQFMGRTDDPKSVLSPASIYLCTSSYEGFPLGILEANACGVPAVSFCFGESAEEVIHQGLTGLIVEQDQEAAYSKALTSLMLDSNRRENMSVNALKFAHTFQAENIIAQWIDLFNFMYQEETL